MAKFRKKPDVIEAMLFDGTNHLEIHNFTEGASTPATCTSDSLGAPLVVPTLEGDMRVSPGDLVIRGVKGEFYPCKPDIFAATYERVED